MHYLALILFLLFSSSVFSSSAFFSEKFSFECTFGNRHPEDPKRFCTVFGKIDRFVRTGQASIQVYCTDGYHLDSAPAHTKNTPSGFEIVALRNPGGPFLGGIHLTLDGFQFSTGNYGGLLRIYPSNIQHDSPRHFSGVCSLGQIS